MPKLFPLACALSLFLASCQLAPTGHPGMPMVETELYFGLDRPGGGAVSAEQFDEFLRTFVSERFPDGLTSVVARGQWRDVKTKRIVAEESRMLVLVHDGGADAERKITEIVDRYKRAYEQQAVMRVDASVRVRF